MFVSKTNKSLTQGRLLDLLTNISLERNNPAVTNALAYFAAASVTDKKGVIPLNPRTGVLLLGFLLGTFEVTFWVIFYTFR